MDEEIKRQVLRKLTYGVFVMTSHAEGKVTASTLTWLSQCSFRPPLVMLGIQKESRMHEAVEKSGALAINLLSEAQADVAKAFFKPGSAEKGLLNGFAYAPGPLTGAPLLAAAPAWLEARVTDSVRRGDHTVFVAEVVNAGLRDAGAKPLLLASTAWNYGG